MSDLLKINYDDDRPTVSGRELHKALEVETPYRLWFPRMCEYGFVQGADYTPYIFVHPQNKQEIEDHRLNIPMAKEVAMLQRTPKGQQVRQYFIDAEESWNRPEMVLARANKIQTRMLEVANGKVFRLEAENAALKPKAAFYDAVGDAQNALTFSEAARLLGIPGVGQNKLFEILRDRKILMKNNLPYQEYMNRGYFRVVEQVYEKGDGTVMTGMKPLIEQPGLDYIRRLLTIPALPEAQ